MLIGDTSSPPVNEKNMKYTCPQCGTVYDLTAEHYNRKLECQCGKKFTVSPPDEEVELEPKTNPNLMECPDCGAMVSKKAQSCPKCGSPFQVLPAAASSPIQQSGPIRVDTGENVLNRNRGCGDILIYSPLLLILFVVILALSKGCAQ
ncbi:MAG: zinc-ribbon domain-containing protein [Lentisphaeria bacterium]|nr:zinc-ribbon domain-containing protein [Lentisphaeria bacterium]